jgi:hypothetical protein
MTHPSIIANNGLGCSGTMSFFELATDRVMGRKHNERGPRAVDRDV